MGSQTKDKHLKPGPWRTKSSIKKNKLWKNNLPQTETGGKFSPASRLIGVLGGEGEYSLEVCNENQPSHGYQVQIHTTCTLWKSQA